MRRLPDVRFGREEVEAIATGFWGVFLGGGRLFGLSNKSFFGTLGMVLKCWAFLPVWGFVGLVVVVFGMFWAEEFISRDWLTV